MKCTEASIIVAKIQSRWAAAFGARAFGTIVELYDDNALFFGSAPQLCEGRKAIRAYFESLPTGIAIDYFPPLAARLLDSDTIIASGFWRFLLNGELLHFRLSWTLARQRGDWLIVQHHAGREPDAAL